MICVVWTLNLEINKGAHIARYMVLTHIRTNFYLNILFANSRLAPLDPWHNQPYFVLGHVEETAQTAVMQPLAAMGFSAQNETMFARAARNRGLVKLYYILLLMFTPKITACDDAEYYIDGECCPMCQAGMRVYRHCTPDSSTSCIPCKDSTYTEKPNGLDRCYGCKLCDSELGLTVVQDCTVFSDTICTCIDGFHCLDSSSSGCKTCQKHRSCSPGQYIKKKGSSIADTECEECPDKTYSDGSLETCKPHTDCQSEVLAKPGTPASDAECKQPSAIAAVIAGTVVGVIALIGALTLIGALVYKHMHNNKGDNMETEKVKETYTPLNMNNGTDSVAHEPGTHK